MNPNNDEDLKAMIDAALLVSGRPLDIGQLKRLFEAHEMPADYRFEVALEALQAEAARRGVELVRVASGWRYQTRADLAERISRLWEEKPQRYSRALMETLALIAYRQPITRGEIEDVRGVAVSTHIMRSLEEREWVRVVGHKEVPGRPALYATTRQFLDDFGLQHLRDLPVITECDSVTEAEAQAEIHFSLDSDQLPAGALTESPDPQGAFGLEDLRPLEDDEGRRSALFAEIDAQLSGLTETYEDLPSVTTVTDENLGNDVPDPAEIDEELTQP
jgi:segregation and condensation protein B